MARTASVTADAQIVRVSGYRVREVLRRYGKRPIAVMGRWTLDRKHLGDVLAALERERYTVQLEDLAPPRPMPTLRAEAARPAVHHEDCGQLW